MMAGLTLVSYELCVIRVVEFHTPHGIALEDDHTRRLALSLYNHGEAKHADHYGYKYSYNSFHLYTLAFGIRQQPMSM